MESRIVGDVKVPGNEVRGEVYTVIGDVTIEGLGEPPELVRVTSTMGDVTVTLPGEVSYAVTTSTDMGADPRVTVDRASDSPYVVDLETVYGVPMAAAETAASTSVPSRGSESCRSCVAQVRSS